MLLYCNPDRRNKIYSMNKHPHVHTHTHLHAHTPAYWHNGFCKTGVQSPDGVIPITQKMVLDFSLPNTHHYKVWIKGEWSNQGKGVAPPLYLGVVPFEKGAFGSSSTKVGQLS